MFSIFCKKLVFGMQNNDTSIDPNLKLDDNSGTTPVDKGSYHRLVGKLTYLSHTRYILLMLSI